MSTVLDVGRDLQMRIRMRMRMSIQMLKAELLQQQYMGGGHSRWAGSEVTQELQA